MIIERLKALAVLRADRHFPWEGKLPWEHVNLMCQAFWRVS